MYEVASNVRSQLSRPVIRQADLQAVVSAILGQECISDTKARKTFVSRYGRKRLVFGVLPLGSLRLSLFQFKVKALHRRMCDADQTIRNYPGTSEIMAQSMNTLVPAWTDAGGGLFEHLLRIVI
jgi:hypothetical protein